MDDQMKEDQLISGLGDEASLDVAEKKASKMEKPLTKMASTYALPASSPEVLSKILKAYVIASKQGSEAVKYTDVAAVASLHPTVVSRNNSFLSEGGFITPERYGYYKPSPETTDYAKQAPWDEENAKGHIRAVIDKTWFGETVQQQLQMQSVLTRSQIIKALGIKATPDASDANKLVLLLDFLVFFKYLETDEQSNFILHSKGEIRGELVVAGDAFVANDKARVEVRSVLPQSIGEVNSGGIEACININLNLTPFTSDEELRLLIDRAKTALNLLLKRPN